VNLADLRARNKRRRRRLDDATRASAASRLTTQFERLLTSSPPRRIAGYAPVRGELDVSPALTRARQRGWSVVLPRVVSGHKLEFVDTRGERARLVRGAFGILEPRGAMTPIEAVDWILVPGTAFDRFGGRVGMGGGFYDRLIEQRRSTGRPCLVIGVGYGWQVSRERLALEPHDQRVDALLTPAGFGRTGC